MGYHEKDPNGIDAHQIGAKLDAGKIPISRGLIQYFPRACQAVAEVSLVGAKKYTWKGWEKVPEGFDRYSDALGRHLIAEQTEGLWDNGPKGTGCLHAAQVAWNAFARLELLIRELNTQHGTAPEPGAIIPVNGDPADFTPSYSDGQ